MLLKLKSIVTRSKEAQTGNSPRFFALLKRPSTFPKYQKVLVVLLVAVVGTGLLAFSSAKSPQLASTDANSIIVQYSIGMSHGPVSTTNLPSPMIPPFTLYGNGLLICGQDSPTPFMPGEHGQHSGPDAPAPALPTSIQLSHDQINKLIKKISDSGFFSLDKEYFELPVAARQDTLRVSLLEGEHYVQYYNDVAAPAAYTQTIAVLQSYCQGVTTPYQPETVTVRTLRGADPGDQDTVPTSSLDPSLQPIIREGLKDADIERTNADSAPITADTAITTPDEANQVLSGEAAKKVVQKLNKKTRQFVQERGATYQVAVAVALPAVNNKLNIDYDEIRHEKTGNGTGTKLQNLIAPKAQASHVDSRIHVRVIYLRASDGGDVTSAEYARAYDAGQRVESWYREQVGNNFVYRGASVETGSQTQNWYMTCHDSCEGVPMARVLSNVYRQDRGTIYASDVTTIVIPAWPMDSLSYRVCGYAFVGYNLGIVEGFAPDSDNPTSNRYCLFQTTVAHELGHTFGLIHTGNGTLMDNPAPYCDIDSNSTLGYPTCTLDADQAMYLAGSKYFVSAPDPPPPTVSITSPANGAQVSGTVNITANASSSSNSISKVSFYINGVYLGKDTHAPYEFSWNTPGLSGHHTLTASASDSYNQETTSSTVTVTVGTITPPPLPCPAPVNFAGTPGPSGSGQYNFTWQAVPSATQYSLRSGNPPNAVYADGFTNNSATAYDLSSTQSYSFAVRAHCGSTESANSNVFNIDTTPPPPPEPTDTTAPVVSITAPVAGSSVSDIITATTKVVDPPATTDGANISKVEFLLDGSLSLIDTDAPYNYSHNTLNLTNGTHTLVVKANDRANPANSSSSSVTFTVNNRDTTAPSVPINLTATATNATTVDLAWGASTDPGTGINQTDVVLYNVLRNGIVIAQPTGREYTDTDRTANTTYVYTVQAVDGAGNTSLNSPAVSVTTPAATDTTGPSVPGNLVANAAARQINLSWNASTDSGGSGLRGYNVYRNGNSTPLNDLPLTTTSYGDGTVARGTTYTYRIEAVDGIGNKSTLSPEISVTSKKIRRGDISGPQGVSDDTIDLRDISFVIRAIQQNSNAASADISGPGGLPDGKVDLRDISYLIRNQGK